MGKASLLKISLPLLGLLFFSNLVFSQPYVGYVYFLSGTAFVSSQDRSTNLLPIEQDSLISKGEIISTGDASRLIVLFRDGSAIKIFEDSVLEIDNFGELADRKFSLGFTLTQGAAAVLISDEVTTLNARVSTYILTGLRKGCFAFSNDPDLGLTRIKTADKSISLSEGLSENKIDARQIFVRFEKAFAFTSKSQTYLDQKILLATDGYKNNVFAVALQLFNLDLAQKIKRTYPISLLGSPRFIFGQTIPNLDDGGYLFINADKKLAKGLLSDNLSCFEVDDKVAMFSFATGVLRGFEAVDY